jgi:hypothetical protein
MAGFLIVSSVFFCIINLVVTATHMQVMAEPNSLGISQQPQNVPFCDLIKQAETYENKLVRVRASFVSNFESAVLYDSGCNDKGNQVEFILDCSGDGSCKEMQEILSKDLKGDPFSGMRADLVMLGRLTRNRNSTLGEEDGGPALSFRVSQIQETIQPAPKKSIPLN